MKKRKIFTLITSSLLCAASAIPIAANASGMMIDINGSGLYEVALQFSETDIIYRGLDREPNDLLRYISPSFNTDGTVFEYLPISLEGLDLPSESDEEVLIDYLSEVYPDLTYDNDVHDIQFPDGTWSQDAYITVMKDVFENTGIRFYYGQLEIATNINLKPLGDLDGDSTVNALDASLVLTYYSDSQTGGLDVYSDEEIQDISLLGDYDGDGTVDAIDASLVLKEYAETQTE